MPRRPTKGHIPHQSKFSPQDVRDAGTPEGTAQINEEFRRLRQALDERGTAEEAVAADAKPPVQQPQTPTKPPGTESPDEGTDLTVKKTNVTVVTETEVLNFLDTPTAVINVYRTRTGQADISVRVRQPGMSVYWGCVYPEQDGGVVGGKAISFFDTTPHSRRHPSTNVEQAPYAAALPIGWEAMPGEQGAVITAYAKHNNLSVVHNPNKRGRSNEVVSRLSTNVVMLADSCDVQWCIAPITREPVDKACHRDGVQITAQVTCDISRTDTPIWRTGVTDRQFDGTQIMAECGLGAGIYEPVIFSQQTIDRPCNFRRPYYTSGGLHYWRFYAEHECGVYNVHAFLTGRTNEALEQNLFMFMVLSKNGTMYSVLDSNKDLYDIESITYPDYDATNAWQTIFNLEGEDDIILRKGEYIEIGFVIQELPIPAESLLYDITLKYGYVNVRYIGSCGEDVATPQAVSNASNPTC